MPLPFRPIPNERNRQKHSLRGLVVEHVNHTTGRWLWKKTFPSIKVSFPEAEYQRFGHIVSNIDPLASVPPNRIEIGYSNIAERDQYRVGEVVDVEFSTSNPIDEFFTGARLFRWEGVKKAYEVSVAS
jgi:hypothetical protein